MEVIAKLFYAEPFCAILLFKAGERFNKEGLGANEVDTREWADFHREIQIQIQIKIQIQMKILFRANTNLSTRSFESLCANEVVTKVEF